MLIKDDVIFGLTPEEVEERVREGKVNLIPNRKTKTYREIFFKNIFTVFNLVIVVMAVFVIPTVDGIKDFGNVLFIGIAFLNLLIGLIQEIKAKKVVDNLLLVTEAKVKVLRNLEIREVAVSEIVIDEIMFLEPGKQICADSKVIQGELFVNESNITGEADDVLKKEGDSLYSGSFVVSGEAYVQVLAVGKDNYVEKLSSQATKYAKPKSEIMLSLNKIINTISIVILPLSVVLYFIYKQYSAYAVRESLILGLVSSINGMIPYGLFLLTTVSLAASVMKLARNKTLVQELYCIEQLARVDVLCLDKTGTITDGTMRVKDIDIIDNKYSAIEIISSMNGSLKGTNQTTKALVDKWGSKKVYKADKILNFNSSNKFSACHFKEIGTFVLGAPDVLIKQTKSNAVLKMVNKRAQDGDRVLALCRTTSRIKEDTLSGTFEPVALIYIHDNIRNGAKETIKEFEENGVTIKIISGDNPITVSSIARDAGVKGYDKYISIGDLSDEEVIKAVSEYTIFGRVKPNQKKIIVETLKKSGHKVAMTGDGVNDILALREADCSIAMAEGSDAAKTVSHLVLLDSNFLSLPKVVNEGRRVINNIQRTAALYLSKTILMTVVNLVAIILFFLKPSLEFTSPFKEPSHLVIIETFIIGFPSFFLALEPASQRIKGRFMKNVFGNSLPGALIIIASLIAIQLISYSLSIPQDIITNISIIAASVSYFLILVRISVPFSPIRIIITSLSGIMIIFSFFLFPGSFHFILQEGTARAILMSKDAYILLFSVIAVNVLFYAIMITYSLLKKKKQEAKLCSI